MKIFSSIELYRSIKMTLFIFYFMCLQTLVSNTMNVFAIFLCQL